MSIVVSAKWDCAVGRGGDDPTPPRPGPGKPGVYLPSSSRLSFHDAITDFCRRSKRPLVLIDAAACRSAWLRIADARLDPANGVIADYPHAEADWGDVRIVRIRTQNALVWEAAQPDPTQLLTVREVAQRLSMSTAKVYSLLLGGHIPSISIDGSRRVEARELETYIASKRWSHW